MIKNTPKNPYPSKITMKDVAHKAGVHVSSVSLALTGSNKIARKTAQKIQKLAIEMGYVRDPSLSALIAYRESKKAKNITQSIGFIICTDNEDNYSAPKCYEQTYLGARDCAQSYGYNVDLFWLGIEYTKSESLDRVLKARGIEKLIITGIDTNNTNLRKLDWNCYSVVRTNLLPKDKNVDTVMFNQISTVRIAYTRLRKLGCKRIGIAVSKADELRTKGMFSAGDFLAHQDFPEDHHVFPLYFDETSQEKYSKEIEQWALKFNVDGLMSNWNSFSEIAHNVSNSTGIHCRYISLCLNEELIDRGGMMQDHNSLGEWAVEKLVSNTRHSLKGNPDNPTTTLIEPYWVNPQ